eukprot:gnl/Hemi2/11366_TR3932_c0_g1_i1.p1 gnl/Hemi2/11366_TR3932_c0_g1~~gnl/Hemi2/11366_TR3932_c0_g1_i1.p1  ORF type:complete len:116 (+),score=25.47 gnl/Hemi2/11366_TR3932_c0_g1_i1:79-426(+)
MAMKFCPECNNMLYPKEDKQNRILMYACRNCDHQEEAQNMCVYKNDVHRAQEGARLAFIHDVTSDPTLPRTKNADCPKCDNREAIMITQTNRTDDRMEISLVCVACNNRFKQTIT